jgi:hypothetical protein
MKILLLETIGFYYKTFLLLIKGAYQNREKQPSKKVENKESQFPNSNDQNGVGRP